VENQNANTSLARGINVLIKTSNFNLVGVIQEVGTHALSVAIEQSLVEGSAVSIEFGAECREGEVVSCRRNGSRYQACVVIPNRNESDRRFADRFPIAQEVLVRADSLWSQLDADIVDLSEHGMGLEISASLKVGEMATVESASNVAFGIVRYCRALDGGHFHAGVEIFHIMPKEAEDSPNPSVVERLFSFH
jgi:hypothetical protein